jgi:hypothetical protein
MDLGENEIGAKVAVVRKKNCKTMIINFAFNHPCILAYTY